MRYRHFTECERKVVIIFKWYVLYEIIMFEIIEKYLSEYYTFNGTVYSFMRKMNRINTALEPTFYGIICFATPTDGID